jgi:WD40 repeat protein
MELHTLKGHTDFVRALKFSPDDQKIASCSVLLCSAQSGELLLTFGDHEGCVWSVTWSPNSKFIAFAGRGVAICVVYAATGKQV